MVAPCGPYLCYLVVSSHCSVIMYIHVIFKPTAMQLPWEYGLQLPMYHRHFKLKMCLVSDTCCVRVSVVSGVYVRVSHVASVLMLSLVSIFVSGVRVGVGHNTTLTIM